MGCLYAVTLGRLIAHRVILCYHNVGTPGTRQRGWLHDSRLIDAREFEAQMRWLQLHCDVVSLDELFNSGGSRKTRVAITFDDGYYNNLSEVIPVMRELKLPMTWFVATGFVDNPQRLPWWDLLDFVLANVSSSVQLNQAGVAGRYDLSDSSDRERFKQSVRRTMKSSSPENGQAVVDELLGQLEGQVELPENAFVREWEIAAAEFDGLELGGHTVSHPNMACCSEVQQYSEVQSGKRRLEEISGRRLKWFAYPFGGRGSFDENSARIVKQAGFEGALTLVPGLVTRQGNPFQLPRIPVSAGQSFSSFKARVVGAPVYIVAARLRHLLG
jgi:peptidoglycan/xylan/chitin deacetylase (PgdA/CDA1 family)